MCSAKSSFSTTVSIHFHLQLFFIFKASKTSPRCTTHLSPILITGSRSTHNALHILEPRSFSLAREFTKVVCYTDRLFKKKSMLVNFFLRKFLFHNFHFHFARILISTMNSRLCMVHDDNGKKVGVWTSEVAKAHTPQ